MTKAVQYTILAAALMTNTAYAAPKFLDAVASKAVKAKPTVNLFNAGSSGRTVEHVTESLAGQNMKVQYELPRLNGDYRPAGTNPIRFESDRSSVTAIETVHTDKGIGTVKRTFSPEGFDHPRYSTEMARVQQSFEVVEGSLTKSAVLVRGEGSTHLEITTKSEVKDPARGETLWSREYKRPFYLSRFSNGSIMEFQIVGGKLIVKTTRGEELEIQMTEKSNNEYDYVLLKRKAFDVETLLAKYTFLRGRNAPATNSAPARGMTIDDVGDVTASQ